MMFKVALLHLYSNGLQEENRVKGEYYVRLAKEMQADMVLFPELWNIGCVSLDDRGWKTPFEEQNPLQRQLYSDWLELAIHPNDPYIEHFCTLAKELRVAIGLTYLEKRDEGPKNTFILIDRLGKIIHNYSKVHLNAKSLENYLIPGEGNGRVELSIDEGPVRLGVLIGDEIERPEAVLSLCQQGIDLLLLPHGVPLNYYEMEVLRVRSYEHRIGIALANYAGYQTGRAMAYSGVPYDALQNPVDMEIIKASKDEGIVIAHFDLGAIRDAQKTMNCIKSNEN